MSYRTGIGYDVHKLVKGRRLTLGGIQINHSHGLDGHSDADVVLHAICDALLGAVGLGDIGEHFPNTDQRYKDISSTVLLKSTAMKVHEQGFKIQNVDVVIMAEEPKLKDDKPRMRLHIADALGLNCSQVNIKAGTHEGLGFIGRQEGIACLATVLVNKD